MQIFSTLPIRSSSRSNSEVTRLGFTLVELLISIAIIGIITSIVLVKYSSFDSTVLLKGLGYEIALALREAQVKSVSVVGSGATFNNPYGVTFTPGTKLYTAFRFPSGTAYPQYADGSNPAVVLLQVPIERSMEIKDVCVTDDGGVTFLCSADGISRLDISFRRPEFKALFYANGYSGGMQNITGAKIKVDSTRGGTNVFDIEVTLFGQISVTKE